MFFSGPVEPPHARSAYRAGGFGARPRARSLAAAAGWQVEDGPRVRGPRTVALGPSTRWRPPAGVSASIQPTTSPLGAGEPGRRPRIRAQPRTNGVPVPFAPPGPQSSLLDPCKLNGGGRADPPPPAAGTRGPPGQLPAGSWPAARIARHSSAPDARGKSRRQPLRLSSSNSRRASSSVMSTDHP